MPAAIVTGSTSPRILQSTPRVKHATLVLQSSAEDMSKSLSHIPPVTRIYFCAYLANSDEGEASHINGSMLSNFLEALIKSSQTCELEHLSLTCGLKQYGVHQGQPKNLMREDDEELLFWLEQEDPLPQLLLHPAAYSREVHCGPP
ncbi:hypothetical protein F4813DRAFT_385000 [Daldinia decipiens]|uniref:uncharacterized protein n=1 Tax=Daldinia decipiens TaxID=326647 RepID=UPI0020C4829D|nr:uncharacterized protein F4813DRAFT_385000 [Daldinia decipiens]KAI1662287.1 hypothetical protein F4813DRAFT_385000 [Daldinia decipiens]